MDDTRRSGGESEAKKNEMNYVSGSFGVNKLINFTNYMDAAAVLTRTGQFGDDALFAGTLESISSKWQMRIAKQEDYVTSKVGELFFSVWLFLDRILWSS